MRILFTTLLLLSVAVPAFAGEPVVREDGKTLAIVDGLELWLDAESINGFPGYFVKFRAYSGDELRGESEVSLIKGYTSIITSTRTRGDVDADGKFHRKTYIDNLLLLEMPSQRGGLSRDEYRQATGTTSKHPETYEPYIELIPKLKKLSFGLLDVYLYCYGIDRYELEIYRNDFPGYVLDSTLEGQTVATLRAPAAKVLEGTFTGRLVPGGEQLFIELPDSAFQYRVAPDGQIVGGSPEILLPSTGGN